MNHDEMRRQFEGEFNMSFDDLEEMPTRQNLFVGLFLRLVKIMLSRMIIVFVPFVLIMGELFEYSVWQYFGKDLPWYMDYFVGTIIAPITFPASIVAWIMEDCDWTAPYFGA